MRSLILGALLPAVIFLAGCSTVQVSQDYEPHADVSLSGTWGWRESDQAPTGDLRVDNPLLDKRIRRAVENHLAARNIAPAQGPPDFYLTYHLAIEQKLESDTYYSSMGAGRGYHPYHPWYGGIGTETRIRQYDHSRLTIDIHAADTGDLIWRGVGVYRLKTHRTPEAAAAAVQNTVDRILGQFPPAGWMEPKLSDSPFSKKVYL